MSAAQQEQLVRAFGTTLLAAAVVNIIVGGGIFALPGRLAAELGAAAPFAFVAGALLMIPVVLCFAAAGSRATATGGPYSYGQAAFGPFAGFGFGALTWISNVTGCAGVAAALVDQAARVWAPAGSALGRPLLLVGLFTLFAALNLRGVALGARAIGVLAAAKLLPLVLLVLIGLWFIEPAQLAVPAWPAWSQWGQALVLVLFAYAGMESALVPTGEVKDPARTVPRAALSAIAFVILLYVGLQLTAQGVLGDALAGDRAPLASTAGALWAPALTLVLIGAAVSMLGYLQGNILGNSRLLYALGRDGALPGVLGRVHARTRVPHVAVIAHATIACLLALGGDFTSLALVSGGAVGLLYLLVCLAAWRLQRRGDQSAGAPMSLPAGPLVPVVGVAAMGVILLSLSAQEWVAIGIACAGSALLYGLVRPRQRWQVLLLAVLLGLVSGAYGLLRTSPVPQLGAVPWQVEDWRALAGEGGPVAVRSIEVARIDAPRGASVAGESLFSQTPLVIQAYQLVYADGRTLMIDSAHDLSLHQAHFDASGAGFDAAAYAQMQEGLRQADRILLTHEHLDHFGGIAHAPDFDALLPKLWVTEAQVHGSNLEKVAFAPGMLERIPTQPLTGPARVDAGVVVIPAPGHSRGSQLIYVRLADGRELLFVGDIAWHLDAIRQVTGRPYLVSRFMLHEDRQAVADQLAALHKLLQAGQPRLVVAHDGEAQAELVRDGLIQAGLQLR